MCVCARENVSCQWMMASILHLRVRIRRRWAKGLLFLVIRQRLSCHCLLSIRIEWVHALMYYRAGTCGVCGVCAVCTVSALPTSFFTLSAMTCDDVFIPFILRSTSNCKFFNIIFHVGAQRAFVHLPYATADFVALDFLLMHFMLRCRCRFCRHRHPIKHPLSWAISFSLGFIWQPSQSIVDLFNFSLFPLTAAVFSLMLLLCTLL